MAITSAKRADASGEFIEIDWLHSLIHQGELFEVNDVDNDVDISGPKYWHLKTKDDDNNAAHFRFDVNCDGGALVELYEAPTLTDDGTSLTVQNMNRRSSKTCDCISAYYDPTVSDDGTRLIVHEIGSNGGGGFFGAQSPGKMSTLEFILKKNTSYLIKITVRQDNSNVDMDSYWYVYNYTELTT